MTINQLAPTDANVKLVRQALAAFINTKTTDQLIDIFIELGGDVVETCEKQPCQERSK